MPQMQTNRLIELSLVKYLQSELTNSGWASVSMVKEFPEDAEKVVASGSGLSGEVVIPALTIVQHTSVEGQLAGIGETIRHHSVGFSILLYALTRGQEQDLRDFLADRLYKGQIFMYDFSASGFPGTGSEPRLGEIYIESLSSAPSYSAYDPNRALRYAGIVNFRVLTFV